ncbi:hypothetical protein ACL90Y_06595 [Micrococcus luteus]
MVGGALGVHPSILPRGAGPVRGAALAGERLRLVRADILAPEAYRDAAPVPAARGVEEGVEEVVADLWRWQEANPGGYRPM